MTWKLGLGACVALLPVAFLAGKGSTPPPPVLGPAPELSALKAEVSEMRKETACIQDLSAELAQVRAENARLASAPKPAPVRETPPAPAPVKADAFEALAERLTAAGATPEGKAQAWGELIEAGYLDRTVALFEKRAQDGPTSADAQVEAGRAYIQKLMTVSDGPVKGFWATKADQAWDAALKLDPRHWEARFSKAIGLSFWPPIFGKQPEAIRQLETLIRLQEEGAPEPRFAQTYVLLGNLYEQQGRHEKAVEVWGRGSLLFPQGAR